VTPSLVVQFTVAADGREVKIDEDCALVLLQISGSAAKAVVSADPKTTVANTFTAPAADRTDPNILGFVLGGVPCGLNIPVEKGRSIFVSCSGAGSVQLAFQLNRVVVFG